MLHKKGELVKPRSRHTWRSRPNEPALAQWRSSTPIHRGRLAAWWNAREAPEPLFAAIDIRQLNYHLKALQEHGVELVLIDTPPALMPTIEAVISVADLVLIPARPSPHDLRSIATTIDLVRRKKKPLVFVVNGATPRTLIAAEAAEALTQHGDVAPITVHQRIDFAASMIDGRTAGEVNPRSRSSQEIADLLIYVNTQLRTDA